MLRRRRSGSIRATSNMRQLILFTFSILACEAAGLCPADPCGPAAGKCADGEICAYNRCYVLCADSIDCPTLSSCQLDPATGLKYCADSDGMPVKTCDAESTTG